jgi:type VI secretion system ImpA family protein
MPLREDILIPIPGENPSGIDLRYETKLLIFDKIKEARRQDDELAQGAWLMERKTANYSLEVKLAQDALATTSKDLQLAAYLTEGLLQTERFAGLREGLNLTYHLLTEFWDTVYPIIEEGDRELRARPLAWIGTQLDFSIRSTPIVESGYSYIAYMDSRAVGYENQVTTDKGRKARSIMIEGGHLVPEVFDRALSETPKAFYIQAEKELDASLEILANLDRFCDDKFENDSPGFGKLETALTDVRRVIHQFLEKKREKEPNPAEEAWAEGFTVADADYSPSPIVKRPAASTAAGEFTRMISVTTPSNSSTVVRVFYATDRREVASRESDVEYSVERSLSGEIHYGECQVSIPTSHKLGRLESPSFLKLEFRKDRGKHIVLAKTDSMEVRTFFERVSASIAKSHARDAFIFIHGYNVSFEDAARRTGQIAFDLQFVGAPIFYSWPSHGKFADYVKDETNVAWSAPHFERFLSLLSQYSGAERIHIIAHSMGNRAVCEALKSLSKERGDLLKLNHLVLAAPDIDADTFQELASMLQRLCGRITLYESSNDKAIHASKNFHGSPRAGEPLLVITGLDTVDASAIDTDFLGHAYFSDNWPLLSDIHSLLFKDAAPAERFGLVERFDPFGKYYAFKA